jgi:NADH-quinone oxidoreductase subunit N
VTPKAPEFDWAALSPLIALTAGACLVLLLGLARSRFVRTVAVPVLTVVALGTTIGLAVWQWGENVDVVSDALRIDDLTLAITILCCATAIGTVALSGRGAAAREAGHGEYHSLLLFAVLGMVILVSAQNLVAVFLGYELLSIPLYVLCATEMRRATSLESGLKYLIVGSFGSAVLLYGLALLYGATGSTDFSGIADALGGDGLTSDVLFLTSLALILTGLAFKASVAPFHQWTPDVYEGAPTPITAFMAVATKAAALGVIIRLFDVALIDAATDWAPAMAVLATATIIIGNVGAIGQTSLKRMLAFSSVAQAGYMLVGVLVTTQKGISAVVFYLAAYLLMNLAAFAVIVIRERETGEGDDISTLHGLGAERPGLAWPMTIAMLSLAGFPATAGFFGKIFLIEAAVDNGWAWLAVVIVIGSAISLAYYLRVVAAVWMRAPGEERPALTPGGRPVMAGGAPDDDVVLNGDDADPGIPRSGDGMDAEGARGARLRMPEVTAVAMVCTVATIALGLYPGPLLDVAQDVGAAFSSLL